MNETAQPIASGPSSKPGNPVAGAEATTQGAPFSRALRNVLWMSSSSVITRIFNLARGIILARLLTPFDFGVYGLAGSIVGIKERVADIGAGSFLVYHPGEVERHAETTFWTNLTLSSLLMVLLAVSAPFLSRIYHEPLLMPVLILLGLGVWARINGSIHQSRLRVKSRFRALAIIDNCSSGAWLIIAVVLAWKGFGVWALVASAAAAGAIWTALLFVTDGWRPRFRISRHSLRLLGGFSFWFLGQGIAWYLVANADRLLVGRELGMSLLGIYVLAYTYASLAVTLISNGMGSVAFAELPKLYGRIEEFWAAYREFSRAQALAACMVAFAGAVAAPVLIPAIFGAKWSAAVLPFQILSVSAALRCLWLDPFLALGKFRSSCLAGFVWVPATALAVWFGLRFGLVGVCCAVVAFQASYEVGTLLLVARSWRKLIEVSRVTTPYLGGGALAALAAVWVRRFVPAATLGGEIASVALALAVFAGIYTLLFKTALKELLHAVRFGAYQE